MRRALPLVFLLALLIPAAAQGHGLSSSSARTETAYYAEMVVEQGHGTSYRVGSCRRHSSRVVSCAFKVYGKRGYRCGGRVRTSLVRGAGNETVSQALVDRCR
jgi:hypothetical protein